MRFDKLLAWPQGVEVVEVELPDGTHYDLHNCGRFLGYEWVSPATLIVRVEFDASLGAAHSRPGSCQIELSFCGVSQCVSRQPEDWDEQEAEQVTGWQWAERPDGRGRVDLDVGGVEFDFVATGVTIRVLPTPDAP